MRWASTGGRAHQLPDRTRLLQLRHFEERVHFHGNIDFTAAIRAQSSLIPACFATLPHLGKMTGISEGIERH